MLTDIRVLDCSHQPGWLAGRVLADMGAEVMKLEAPGSNLGSAQWRAYNVNKRLLELDVESEVGIRDLERIAANVDVIITSFQPESTSMQVFDYARLSERNRGLILVLISPFGETGPRADWLASDIELMAAGGTMSLAGEPGETPVRITAPQSYAWTGVQAAIGALMAINGRRLTGKGQVVRVSAQAAVLPALAFAPCYWDMNRVVPTRGGSFATGRSITGARYRVFWKCRDGYLNFIIYGGPAGRRTNKSLLEWMLERGFDPGVWENMDWDNFSPVKTTQAEVDAMEQPIARFFATLTKKEFLQGAGKREMLGYPVSSVADIAADPQLQARNFWSDLTGLDGVQQRHCGSFYMLNGERPPLRYAPPTKPLDIQEILAELTQNSDKNTTSQAGEIGVLPGVVSVLEGLKVVEFGGYAAGPQIGKILANFGATVVHVESKGRPDGFRSEYPPFKDDKPGLNRGGCFAIFNDSKLAVTLDIKKPGGVELGRHLVDWSDVVIENMRPGVIARMGLGYDTFEQSNPGLIMLSTCNMGQTGPRANTPGFGSQLSALAGFSGLTGAADGPPMLLYGPYIDFIAAGFGAAAVLGALEQRHQTGCGAQVDLSQYECGLHFIAPELLEFHDTGKIAERDCNADPAAVPHGAFACLDDKWVVLSCWSDEEFIRLTRVIEHPELAIDEKFFSQETRKTHEAELNVIIAAWCYSRDVDMAATELQNAGVHAYPVNTVADVFSDPQLLEQKTWRQQRHPVMGEQAYMFPAFDLADMPGDITSPAPLFGGDNDKVFRAFLGLTVEEYAASKASGAIGVHDQVSEPDQQAC